MAAHPRLTAAVLTYDGRHLLETALPSFEAQTLAEYRLLVVDNGSSDDTLEWLAANHPGADVVSIPQNVGVSAALNRCWEAADTELVALFNNDIELDPRCLEELVRAMDEHPEAGSAGAKLVNFHDRTLLDGAGDVFDWGGTGMRRGHGEPDRGQYEEPAAIFAACGGAAVYRRSALERVGPFDERFFAFNEDVDWAFRAQLAGYACRYVPTAVAYHMGSATIGAGMTDFTRYQLTRNAVWVAIKNYPAAALLRHLPRLAYVNAANLYLSARAGQLGVWLRAWRDALRALPAVLRDRRAVQATRRASVQELERAARAK